MPTSPFAYLDARNPLHALYVQVMSVFLAAKRGFVVHLRPEDVAAALNDPVAPEAMAAALEQLYKWGNLHQQADTGRVTAVEDFNRARHLYQLTPEGEAAQRAAEFYDEQLGRRGSLQSVALEDVRVRLRNLRDLAATADPDPALVHGLLRDLFERLDSLAENAVAFMNGLQRTIDLHDVDEESFLAFKDRLIDYLKRFIADLVSKSHDIGRTLADISEARADEMLRLAVDREAVDLAPGPDRDAEIAALHDMWRVRWSGLHSWFGRGADRGNQAALLRQRARKAIPELLATVGLLQERRAGRSDRTADFVRLAQWFAQAPDDESAHRLWRAAFGLSTARHLTGTATDEAAPRLSWRDAPVVEIAPRLRATGHYKKRGRLAKVTDRSAERAHLAALVAAEAEQTRRARQRLATGVPTKLSDLGGLDRTEFRFFLELLRTALSAGPPRSDGRIRTDTGDGTLRIILEPVPDGPLVELPTEDGVMYGPEYVITITDLADT
ncbi:hypothetical protein Afil01_42480 [Actinorhabdospora filicis]|uniref:TIGR02677 family protein n=1 Tax=Actinorhabdospora filicis TaxID=1785913 RepID=A0A9W6SNX8_9ACTN|nr:hypothetical protein Afil01_42480 [Actinorhabdospora filicis]